MNIKELSQIVSKKTGEPGYKVAKIINAFIVELRIQIIRAQMIKLKNLLTVFIDVVPEKNFFNASTNQHEKLPRRFKLIVKPSINLKKEVNAKKTY